MSYERFTERLPNGICRVKCNEHCKNFKDSQERMCDAYEECNIASVEYLAELEDDLESGKMIRLPCKVGQKIYRKDTNFEWEIVACIIYEDEIIIIDDSDNEFGIDDIGKTVFLTKAEAEAKLEELKGEV